MKTLELKDGFYWAGIVDDSLRVFDIIMYTEFGTTYNSYVWKTGDKTILFETAKGKCFDEYLDKLKEIIDVTKIDYLVVSKNSEIYDCSESPLAGYDVYLY